MLPGPKDPRVAYNGVKTCGGKGFHGQRQQKTSQPTAEKKYIEKNYTRHFMVLHGC